MSKLYKPSKLDQENNCVKKGTFRSFINVASQSNLTWPKDIINNWKSPKWSFSLHVSSEEAHLDQTFLKKKKIRVKVVYVMWTTPKKIETQWKGTRLQACKQYRITLHFVYTQSTYSLNVHWMKGNKKMEYLQKHSTG